jgi:methylthioribose-1-phosphate isomerase
VGLGFIAFHSALILVGRVNRVFSFSFFFLLKTIHWSDGKIVILDQRLLPLKERYLRCKTAEEVAIAIENMAIRGAPAIGVACALGLALGARQIKAKTCSGF